MFPIRSSMLSVQARVPRSVGRLSTSVISHLDTGPSLKEIYRPEITRLEENKKKIEKLVDLYHQTAFPIGRYDGSRIAYTVNQSNWHVRSLYYSTIKNMNSLLEAAERSIARKEFAEAEEGLKRIIDVWKQLNTEDVKVNPLMSQAFCSLGIAMVSLKRPKEEIRSKLNHSLKYDQQNLLAKSLIKFLDESYQKDEKLDHH